MSRDSADLLQRWVRSLGEYLEAQVSDDAKGWRMEGTSDTWKNFVEDFLSEQEREALRRKIAPMVVVSEPGDQDEWRDRLRLVERAAARQLTCAPIGFAATLPAASKQSPLSTVVRLAFGLSLSLGYRLRQRFTAYFLVNEGQHFLQTGDDPLFMLGAIVGPLDLKRSELRMALPTLLAAVGEAQESYRHDSPIVAEVDRLRQNYAQDLQCLERLYTTNSGKDARLLGQAPKGLKGDDAIEAEYVARLEDLVDRYRPRVIFEPLTIGVIEGCNKQQLLPGGQ
ncbi:MAG: hypothetical protein HYX75_14085 [Acidobacteria bacterium]|nr:hypothetical protein [Acidobacteriota bacterium]